MRRYFIELAFDGTAYHGWQIQKNAHSVQEELNRALFTFFRETVETIGCGRTDTGVHARQFFAHFDRMDQVDTAQLKYKLNRLLPADIGVMKISEVNTAAHARYSATSRTYKYYIVQEKEPYYLNKCWYLYGKTDTEKMNEAARILMEYTDFSSFSKSRTQVKTNICHIYHAEWIRKRHILVFTIKADRFLRNMVRAIVGTMVEIGRGEFPAAEMRNVVEQKSRSAAGISVPASGLFLTEITYPPEILIERDV